MPRRVGALIALGLALLGVGPVRAVAARRPAHLLVYAQEWSLWGSRSAVPRGTVTVELWNRGQDAHDLRIRRLSRAGHRIGGVQGVAVTRSGALQQASWRLGPGHYELYCSMPGHRARGMHTLLVVR